MVTAPSARRSDNLLLIAAREPVPGSTKTRLGRAIGMEAAATLYRAFLSDLAARFTPPALAIEPLYDLGWAYTPSACDFARVLAGLESGPPSDPGIHLVPQQGSDWGARQANLLRWGRDAGYQRTVLTASDSPQMSLDVVLDAFRELERHEVVLGRVADGGYYLIGVSGPYDVLESVPMSTASAAAGVLQRTAALGLRAAEVAATFDIDEAEDLEHLRRFCVRSTDEVPATAAAIRKLGR
ncbi:MAG TPA: TIGR04282 family arsenosugar biosynthesis glycosyltransferase [Thermomicrobiales bacterium]|nr:TIGR04282 family arsenosugar biosynthesis glycosyltransferase [Thermomicrobiales bacterium]